MSTHFTTIETSEKPISRDWSAIRGEVSACLIFFVAIMAGVAWHKGHELQKRQIEIAEKHQHILELYASVLQKDIDEFKAEVRSYHNPRTPGTPDKLPGAE